MSVESDLSVRLIGTWHYAKDGEPSGRAFFCFGEDGRFLEFVFDPKNEERWPFPMWYSVESSDQVRLRSRPAHEGWTRHCEFRDGVLVLSTDGRQWICTRAEPHEIPQWFSDAVANFKATGSARPFKWKV